MDFKEAAILMDKVLNTINGDMDFTNYTFEELHWVYQYSMDYKPEGYVEVISALLKASYNKNSEVLNG